MSALTPIRSNRRLFTRTPGLNEIVGQGWVVDGWVEKYGKISARFVIIGLLTLFLVNLTVKANWHRVFHGDPPSCAHPGPGYALIDGKGVPICVDGRGYRQD